ncbi:MAG: hypothetical protein HUJ25_18445 [Crocinitomicaceae bacterium]|nr:hypothetical protein [Crocinitomicaceae bacterium]
MRILALFFLLISSSVVKAAAWDNLTAEQANQVIKFLEKNPFVFDFCDCCGESVEVYLLRVKSAKMIKCAWDKKQYNVLTKSKRIAKMQWANVGIDDYHTDVIDEDVEYTIFMNYTFAFDAHMKWAVPLFKLFDYHVKGPICIGATNYPNPSDAGVKITDEDYIEWYRATFQ